MKNKIFILSILFLVSLTLTYAESYETLNTNNCSILVISTFTPPLNFSIEGCLFIIEEHVVSFEVLDSYTNDPLEGINLITENIFNEIVFIDTTDSQGLTSSATLVKLYEVNDSTTSPWQEISYPYNLTINIASSINLTLSENLTEKITIPFSTKTPISNSTLISEGGEYVLTDDINMTKSRGIEILHNNVVLDCLNHKIYSDIYSTGIYAMGENITIKNCDVSVKSSVGIYLNNTASATIIDNYIHGNAHGIYTLNTDNSIIQNNLIENTHYHGIYGRDSDNNIITSNNISHVSGPGIFIQSDSNNNIISNNIISNVITGISLSISNFNIITDNHIYNNYDYPIRLFWSSDNNVTDNLLLNNVHNEIAQFHNSDRNTIEPNQYELAAKAEESTSIIFEEVTTGIPIVNISYKIINEKKKRVKIELIADVDDNDFKKIKFKVNNNKYRNFCRNLKDGACTKGYTFKKENNYNVEFKTTDKSGNTVFNTINISI